MVAGLLLPSQNGEPLIWTKSGGLYPLADGCREDARQALGKWVDFSSEKGVVTRYEVQKGGGGGSWPLQMNNGIIDMKTPIIIPDLQQEQAIGWDQPSVWSTVVGRAPISQHMLDRVRAGPSFRPNHGLEACLRWNPELEKFIVLEGQKLSYARDGRIERMLKGQLEFAPWNQTGRQDRGWIEGVTTHRTNHTMFVATKHGNFILTANAIRHGRLAPDFDLLIRCRVFTNEMGQEAAGEVAEYEVSPLSDDLALYRNYSDKFATYKAIAEVLEVNVDGALLEHPVLGQLHDRGLIKKQVKPGDQVVIEAESPKGESGWKVRAFIELSSRRRRSRAERKKREVSLSGSPMEYLYGFVINSTKEWIFIAFQDGVVGVWNATSKKMNPEPLTADDFVFCEVGPPEPFQNSVRRKILGLKKVEWPLDFSRLPNQGRPVSLIEAPARFVKFVDWDGRDVPTFANEYMPVIYDFDGETISHLPKDTMTQELRDMDFVLGVSHVTLPKRPLGNSGWLVRKLLDRRVIVRQPEPRPLSRNHRQVERLPANQSYYEPRDYRPTSRNSFDDEFGNGPVLVRTPPPERDPNYREPEHVPRQHSRVGYREQHNYSPQQVQFDDSFRSYQPGPSTQRVRPQWEKYSTAKRQSPALDESLSGQNSGHLDQSFTQAPKRRYPASDVPVTGVCIKAWGGYRIVWLRDGRLALLDTKKKPTELGSFITGLIERLGKPMYDKRMRYDWQVNGFWPCEEAYDVEPLTDGQWARFVCPKARVLEYRPFEDKRVVVLDDVFFGEFLDRDDVLEKLEPAPDDEIEVTIRAEITSETTIDWVVESQEAEPHGNDKPSELAEKKPEIITKSTVAALPIPDVVPGAKHDLRRDSESDYGISSNSSQSGEAMPEMTHRELVIAMLNNSRVKEAIQRRQPEALEKAQALLRSNTDQ